MPSMVRVGNLGSRWGPPSAGLTTQTGSNTSAEHERKRAIKRKRPFTLPRHLEALPRLRQGFPPLRAHVEGSAPPSEAVPGRSGRSGGPFRRPTDRSFTVRFRWTVHVE